MKLLHIDSSILGDNSVSRSLTASIVARLKAADPALAVTHRDVAKEPLSHLDILSLPGDGSNGAVASAAVLDEFLAAAWPMIGFRFRSRLP